MAIRFSQAKAAIYVRIDKKADGVELIVKDYGLPENLKDKNLTYLWRQSGLVHPTNCLMV